MKRLEAYINSHLVATVALTRTVTPPKGRPIVAPLSTLTASEVTTDRNATIIIIIIN